MNSIYHDRYENAEEVSFARAVFCLGGVEGRRAREEFYTNLGINSSIGSFATSRIIQIVQAVAEAIHSMARGERLQAEYWVMALWSIALRPESKESHAHA